jgi:hypothetical protein
VALRSGVHEVSAGVADAAAQEASRTGAQLFCVSRQETPSRAAFFDAVRAGLPLDPPLVGSKSWDALSDSLWGGLDALEASVVVITWTGASDLRRDAPEEFGIAMRVLRDLVTSLGSWEDTNGEPKQVCIYVA